MQVTNLTNETIGIAGISIPKRQSRTVRDWDRVKDSRRVRELLDSGSINVPGSSYVTASEADEYAASPEQDEPEEQPKRGFFGSLRDDDLE